jgi:hypothetical protein
MTYQHSDGRISRRGTKQTTSHDSQAVNAIVSEAVSSTAVERLRPRQRAGAIKVADTRSRLKQARRFGWRCSKLGGYNLISPERTCPPPLGSWLREQQENIHEFWCVPTGTIHTRSARHHIVVSPFVIGNACPDRSVWTIRLQISDPRPMLSTAAWLEHGELEYLKWSRRASTQQIWSHRLHR